MSAVDIQTSSHPMTRRPARRLAGLWAAASCAAVLMVTLAYATAREITGPPVVAGAGEVTLINTVVFTLIGGMVGATLAYLLGRFARRPRLVFLTTTIIALAGYAVVPFTAANTLSSAIWLNVFHIVVAIPVIGILTRYLPRVRQDGSA